MTPSLIPSTNPLKIITAEGDGFRVATLGDEVTQVDESTGEVCRRRQTVKVQQVANVGTVELADILLSLTKDNGDKRADMAHTLLTRAKVHLDAYAEHVAKLHKLCERADALNAEAK